MLPPDLVALAIGFEAVASGRDLRGVVSVVLLIGLAVGVTA
jgi:hypothetical protein